jgi:hypothetical protein
MAGFIIIGSFIGFFIVLLLHYEISNFLKVRKQKLKSMNWKHKTDTQVISSENYESLVSKRKALFHETEENVTHRTAEPFKEESDAEWLIPIAMAEVTIDQ